MKNLSFELFVGKKNEIGTEANAQDVVAWLVLRGNKTAHLMPSDTLDEFYGSLTKLSHLANGDFSDWKVGEHYPKRVVKSSIFTISEESLTGGTVCLRLADDGMWYEIKKIGKAVAAAPERQEYHNLIDYALRGDTLALSVPTFLGKEYIRQVKAGLDLGVGKAWEARLDAIEEAQIEKEIYKARRPYVQNGRSVEVGLPADTPTSAQPKALVVRLTEGGILDMATVKSGTMFQVSAGRGIEYSMEWVEGDAVVLEGWQYLAGSDHLSVEMRS
jgi:hypothetical protein